MAVGFERRNVGVLADLPSFADTGESAYVDYGATPVADATREAQSAPEASPYTGDGKITPEEAQAYMASLDAQQAAAKQYADNAGKPLNRGLSVLSGILGAPVRLLQSAFDGADVQNITAPFRPRQTAEDRYLAVLGEIGKNRLALERTMSLTNASNAQALRTALTSRRETEDAWYTRLGNLALQAVQNSPDPRAQEQFFNESLSRLSPEEQAQLEASGLGGLRWSPKNAAYVVARAGNKDLTDAFTKATQGEGVKLGMNETYLQIRPDGSTRQTFLGDQAPPNFANPFIQYEETGATAPAPAAVDPSVPPQVLTPEAYQGLVQTFGKEGADGYVQKWGATVQPAGQPDFSQMTDEQLDAYINSQGGQ